MLEILIALRQYHMGALALRRGMVRVLASMCNDQRPHRRARTRFGDEVLLRFEAIKSSLTLDTDTDA